jgi:F0F1-type ATP synthase membrane subunit b/b'
MMKLILPAIHLFGLVAFILYKVKTPFFRFLNDRQKEISDGLGRAKTQAESAARRKIEIEARLATLDREKALIAGEWKEKLARQTSALQDSSARVIAQMKREAEQNRKALEAAMGQDELLAFRRAVMKRASEKIESALDAGAHLRLREKFVREIQSSGAGEA